MIDDEADGIELGVVHVGSSSVVSSGHQGFVEGETASGVVVISSKIEFVAVSMRRFIEDLHGGTELTRFLKHFDGFGDGSGLDVADEILAALEGGDGSLGFFGFEESDRSTTDCVGNESLEESRHDDFLFVLVMI